MGVMVVLLLAVLAAQPVAAGKIQYSTTSVPSFSYPVSAEVGEGVNYSLEATYHQNADRYAIDFLAPGNNDQKKYGVYATLAGRVVYAACKDESYGCAVAIRHWDDTKWDKKYYSIYAHLGSINVAVGNLVDTTTRIGWMGKTGASGNGIVHLHFAVRSSDYVYDGATALYGQYITANRVVYIITSPFYIRPFLRRFTWLPNWWI